MHIIYMQLHTHRELFCRWRHTFSQAGCSTWGGEPQVEAMSNYSGSYSHVTSCSMTDWGSLVELGQGEEGRNGGRAMSGRVGR